MWMCLMNLNTTPHPHSGFLLATQRFILTMPKLHCFFNKAFKASKCATLLKLTIPRIKLLRNRREVQLKQMRNDVAILLEAGQETKAIVKVEHVMREENMMAAQDIIQIFCELIVARLPMIQSQRECPLDLKEAISSVCFAAPRCADLPELLQVQSLFASKYGKGFVSSAAHVTPDCSVNRQLIELLSVQAPSEEKKLNFLKEIAVEHNLDWDPTASETKILKKHEDLLNGPVKSQCESKLPLPAEKHSEVDLHSSSQFESFDKDKPITSFGKKESKQCTSRTKTEANLESQDVLAAAETAEIRSTKHTKKNRANVSDSSFENPFCTSVANKSETEKGHFTDQNTAIDHDGDVINDVEHEHAFSCSHSSSFSSFDTPKEDSGSSLHDKSPHQHNRLPSVDACSDFSYPNLFTSQNSNFGFHSSDNRYSSHDCDKKF
ncbi:DNA mismatch repair protein MSH2 [Vigna unguiculata]|uniref:DNA mismatch repair protein MSH2 n=1 Tax=Vigna unguiculata TaxID=3917 RepID=A0A4D6N555_VIGUN|nr:DNA mismatch repair protein MSH2 [Vigna unguiculata]